jgi:hypothetical protein
LCPSNVTSVKEFIVVDEISNNDLLQVNLIPNQYGVYLDLVYCNFPEMVGVGVAERSLLRLGMYRLKYAQYIERIEAGLKSNSCCFFLNLKRNSSGYQFAMFLGDTCARNAQGIANLFGEYFQGVYVRDDS